MSEETMLRQQVIEGLLAASAPMAEAQAIADTAFHAVREALETVKRITDALPGANNGTAAMIALQVLEGCIPANVADLVAKMQQLDGVRSVEVEIGGMVQ